MGPLLYKSQNSASFWLCICCECQGFRGQHSISNLSEVWCTPHGDFQGKSMRLAGRNQQLEPDSDPQPNEVAGMHGLEAHAGCIKAVARLTKAGHVTTRCPPFPRPPSPAFISRGQTAFPLQVIGDFQHPPGLLTTHGPPPVSG